MNHYEIYTDGSFKGRWGSWSYLILQNNIVIFEASGREKKTNSNRMEFQAVIEALKKIPLASAITVFTDFKILIENISLFSDWSANSWMKKNNKPIPNVDQLKILQDLLQNRNVTFQWIKAHSGNPYNERCDELCILARNL